MGKHIDIIWGDKDKVFPEGTLFEKPKLTDEIKASFRNAILANLDKPSTLKKYYRLKIRGKFVSIRGENRWSSIEVLKRRVTLTIRYLIRTGIFNNNNTTYWEYGRSPAQSVTANNYWYKYTNYTFKDLKNITEDLFDKKELEIVEIMEL